MTRKRTLNPVKIFAVLLALVAPAEAMAQGSTIYANDRRVVGRYTTDLQGTTTLYDASGRVINRATGNITIIHDGVSGQVLGGGKTTRDDRRPVAAVITRDR